MPTASGFWAHQGLTWDLACGKLGDWTVQEAPGGRLREGNYSWELWSARGLVAFRADVPCSPSKQRPALPGPLALGLRTQDAGVCGGCVLSESCWKLSKRTPCRRQSKGPLGETRELSGRGRRLLCQLLKQFLPPSPCRYHGAASEGWGVCPPPMGSVSSGCSILEAVWQGGHTWVVGPDWSPVPVPPLLRDLLVSSALDIDSRCVLVFVKVNE